MGHVRGAYRNPVHGNLSKRLTVVGEWRGIAQLKFVDERSGLAINDVTHCNYGNAFNVLVRSGMRLGNPAAPDDPNPDYSVNCF